MKFYTETGSVYEVDLEHKRIRRVLGEGRPTARVGEHCWREYEDMSLVKVGRRVLVSWPPSVPLLEGSPSEAVPCTITSGVVRVEND